MRSAIFIVFCIAATYCNGQSVTLCKPTINIDAIVFPSKTDSAFFCPSGGCCIRSIQAKDKQLEVISFKVVGYKLCNREVDLVDEADNIGSFFSSPKAQMIIINACKGSMIQITCIKAKSKNGQVYTLNPLSFTIE